MSVIEDILKRLEALEAQNYNKPMNFKQACTYLGYSPKYLYKLCYTGKFPFHNPTGRTLFFYKYEIDDWVKTRRMKIKKV